jgi:hypothetical protein
MATTPAAPVFEACAQCGESFARGVRYPVVVLHDPSGDVRLHTFCDERCRQAWEAEG